MNGEEGRFSRSVVHNLGCILESPWGAVKIVMCGLWEAPLEILINLVGWVVGSLSIRILKSFPRVSNGQSKLRNIV